jgi:hypothetical protein
LLSNFTVRDSVAKFVLLTSNGSNKVNYVTLTTTTVELGTYRTQVMVKIVATGLNAAKRALLYLILVYVGILPAVGKKYRVFIADIEYCSTRCVTHCTVLRNAA